MLDLIGAGDDLLPAAQHGFARFFHAGGQLAAKIVIREPGLLYLALGDAAFVPGSQELRDVPRICTSASKRLAKLMVPSVPPP